MPGVDYSVDLTCQLMQREQFDDRVRLFVCDSTELPSSPFWESLIYYGRVRAWIVGARSNSLIQKLTDTARKSKISTRGVKTVTFH